jgi:D-glucosaminate-6-phosphate ammonia-lyase
MQSRTTPLQSDCSTRRAPFEAPSTWATRFARRMRFEPLTSLALPSCLYDSREGPTVGEAEDDDERPSRVINERTERGGIYRRLGVEPIVNGTTTMTVLGGSLMPPEVLDAMREAAQCYVDLHELQEAVGRRIAVLTRNEAAFVAGGAAAGLFLSAAACMTRATDDGILRLDKVEALPREFVIHRVHRVPYDLMIGLAGGSLREIGGTDGTDLRQLEEALAPSTAAVLYIPKAHLASAVLPLELVVERAHVHRIPVIVDAAAQLPPVDNLWRFTQAGADLVLFSGGKALSGPASTGLILGRRRFMDRIAANAAPLQRLGRPMKVGKEDLVGILAAVEWYLRQDHEVVARWHDEVVEHFLAWGRGRVDVVVTREELGEAGQPAARARIQLSGTTAAGRDEILTALRATRPRVDLLPGDDDSLFVAPETLLRGEEEIVSRKLDQVLALRGTRYPGAGAVD